MDPIRTDNSSFIYKSPNPDIADMPGERVEPGHVRSVWRLTERERSDITQGLNIGLDIYSEPIPPVSLGVTYEGATLLMSRPLVVAERFVGDDGQWYLRLLSEHGATLALSRGYARRLSAWRAQRRLKKILPELELWPHK